MNDYNSMPQTAHRLELTGRERLTVSGVEDVERFDETGIVMSTSAGPWETRSPSSCWYSASRFCWACAPDCCTTCCGPSASASPD